MMTCCGDLSAAYAHLEALESVDNGRIGVLGHCLGGRIAWVAACGTPATR